MRIQFDGFELDTNLRALYEHGALRSVEPQVFDILTYLIQHRDRIVEKEDLVTNIWNGRAISDAAINSRVRSARQSIGDNGKDQKYIKTVHGKGFRFLGDVTVTEEPSAPTEDEITQPPSKPSSPTRVFGIAGILAVFAISSFLYFEISGTDSATEQVREKRSVINNEPAVAVLPFSDLSETSGKDALAEGFTEELLNVLAQNSGLRVSSRTSAASLQQRGLTIPEISNILNVNHVVEGSLRVDGNQVRVTVQMIEAATDRHFWSRAFDADLQTLSFIDLQSDIASAISEELAVTAFTGKELKEPQTDNSLAFQAYLRGLGLMQSSLDMVSMEVAIEELTKAITLDPEFGDAYAARAQAYMSLDDFSGVNQNEVNQKSDDDLAKAEELNSDSVSFLMGKAIKAQGDADYEEVLRLTARAIAKDGNSSQAYNYRGLAHFYMSDYDAAISMLEKGLTFDPLASDMLLMLSEAHVLKQDWEKALEVAERNYRWNRNSIESMASLTGLYQHFGRYADAFTVIQDIRARFPKDSFSAVYGGVDLATIEADVSVLAEAKTDLERAAMYLALGDDRKSSEWLEKSHVFTLQSMTLAGYVGNWELIKKLARETPFFSRYANGKPMESDIIYFDLVANLVDAADNAPRYPANRDAILAMFEELEVGDLESQDAVMATAWLWEHGKKELALDYLEHAANDQFFYWDGFRDISLFAGLNGNARFEAAFDKIEENRKSLTKDIEDL